MSLRIRARSFPPCEYKYVRQIGPDSFEARLRFLDHRRKRSFQNLSLGVYPSARAAWKAWTAAIKHIDPKAPETIETLYRAAVAAMATGDVRADLLPKYVRRLPCGSLIGKVRCQSGEVLVTGLHCDPIQALREAVELKKGCLSLAA